MIGDTRPRPSQPWGWTGHPQRAQSRDGRSGEAPAGVRAQARLRGDARARRRGAAGRRAGRRGSSSRSTTPPGCTGTCGWSATACSPRGRSPTACRPSRRTTAWPSTPRTTRSSTSSSTARSRRAATAPGTMTIWDRGTYEELKWEPRKVEVAPARRARAGALRAVPAAPQGRAGGQGLDDPPHGPARRPGAPSPCPSSSCRCSRRSGALPRDDDALGLRDQVGRRARDRPLRAGPAALLVAQPATTSPPAIPSWPG